MCLATDFRITCKRLACKCHNSTDDRKLVFQGEQTSQVALSEHLFCVMLYFMFQSWKATSSNWAASNKKTHKHRLFLSQIYTPARLWNNFSFKEDKAHIHSSWQSTDGLIILLVPERHPSRPECQNGSSLEQWIERSPGSVLGFFILISNLMKSLKKANSVEPLFWYLPVSHSSPHSPS